MNRILITLLAIATLLPLSCLAQHVQIPGTPVEMIAPEGFIPAGKFAGFQQEETQSSVFVALIPVPENILEKTLQEMQQALVNPEKLKQQNMRLISNQSITLNQQEVMLLKTAQSAYASEYHKWILLLNNDENIIMVNGVFPKELTNDLDQPILDAILSTRLINDAVISPFDAVNFTIQESQRFVINQDLHMPTAVFLSEPDAPHPTLPEDHPTLIVGQAYSTVVINRLEAFSRERLSQYPQIKEVKIEHTQTQTLDDLQAFEAEARAIDYKTGAPLAVLQVIIADKATYYIATGLTAYDRRRVDFKDFRDVIYTFVRKPKVKQ